MNFITASRREDVRKPETSVLLNIVMFFLESARGSRGGGGVGDGDARQRYFRRFLYNHRREDIRRERKREFKSLAKRENSQRRCYRRVIITTRVIAMRLKEEGGGARGEAEYYATALSDGCKTTESRWNTELQIQRETFDHPDETAKVSQVHYQK